MGSAIPGWLTPVAWTYIALSLLSAAFIAFDVYARGHRHVSMATELVWITSGLYLGPFAIAIYLRQGRANASSVGGARATGRRSASPATAVLPGGGASAVAHLIGVPLVVAVGWTILGMAMWAMMIVIAILAIIMLAAYERVASHDPGAMHTRSLTVFAAIVAAVVTVAAFDVGMVGWMLLLHFNNAMPPVTDGAFWFLMQVGVVIGLLTGYPAVRWLLRHNQAVVPHDTAGLT